MTKNRGVEFLAPLSRDAWEILQPLRRLGTARRWTDCLARFLGAGSA